MLRRSLPLLLPLLLTLPCLSRGTPTRAASDPPQNMNFTLEGKIQSKTQNKLTISTEENIIFHVVYDEKTEIKHQDDSAATANDLRVGLRVRVDGDLTESGEIIAHRIELLQAAPEKKSSSLSKPGAL